MNKRVAHDLLTYRLDDYPLAVRVAKQYRIADGILRSVGPGVSRSYSPFAEVNLPTTLARISDGQITPLQFASEYGELGYPALVRASLLPTLSSALPKTDEWKAAYAAFRVYRDAALKAASKLPKGDPVEWILAHSRTVALCLDFIGLLAEKDEHRIRDAVEGVTRGPYAIRDRLVTLPVREWGIEMRVGLSASAKIRLEVCHLLTENMGGVRREFITDPFGANQQSVFLYQAPVEAVYWQLADKMEAGMIRRCEECRKFFVARDKRVLYCPPLPGSTRSRCSSRLNVNSFRGRQES